MKNDLSKTLSRNIHRYRKEKGLTQEDLAKELGLTFQAISKWETAQALPDIAVLPGLSQTLGISIDRLLGFCASEKQTTIYEEKYKSQDYYWGIDPSPACYSVLQLMPPVRHLRILDVGCGEGKDAVFFARNGYDVTAFDISDAGIEKTKTLAENVGVKVRVLKADILDYRLDTRYDILYSSGVFHYIPPHLRNEIMSNYKEYTNTNGLHVFNAFVKKPFIDPPPENEPTSSPWISGELSSFYSDWFIHDCAEKVFDCHSSGIPHRHAMSIIIAKKCLPT